MNYSAPYPSSVPHIILVPSWIAVSPLFYWVSFSIQLLFCLLAVILFGFAIFFRCKNDPISDGRASSGEESSEGDPN